MRSWLFLLLLYRIKVFYERLWTQNLSFQVMRKIKLDWKHTLFFLALMGGIYYLTDDSLLMSLGIMLLLFVVDYFLCILDDKIKEKKKMRDEQ